MFDLTNQLFHEFYVVFAASSHVMQEKTLIKKAVLEIKNKYSDRFAMDFSILKKRNSYSYYYAQQRSYIDKTIDIFIKFIISEQASFVIFSINHYKLDAALTVKIYNDIYDSYCKFEPIVAKINIPIPIKCGKVLLPIKCVWVDKLAEKYSYSKNLIMQSIWSMYLNYKCKCDNFTQLVSIRGDSSKSGNYIYIDKYKASSNLKDTCEIVKQGVVNAKQIKRTQLTLPLSLLSAYNSVLFNNWYSLCPSHCNGIFLEGLSDINWHPFPNVVFILIQNNSYVLVPHYPKLPMWQTDMRDFKEFCKQF